MSRPTERTDQPDAVPPPELNPLVNPLLAQHMGRWAEVYFNNPPEKREEAVQNLLRELRGEKPARQEEVTPEPTLVRAPLSEIESSPALRVEREVVCPHCGHVNRDHRFCGMCGTELADAREEGQRTLNPGDSPAFLPKPSDETGADMDTQSENSHYFLDESQQDAYRSDAYPDDHLLFESVGPSFSYGYRVVIGLVLAIAIGALGYMAWRSGQNGTDTSQASAAPVVEQPAPEASKPASSTPSTSASPRNTAAKNEATPVAAKDDIPAVAPAAKAAPPEPAVSRASEKSTPEPAADTRVASRATRAARVEKTSSTQANPANGAEELAVAERYLNASSGQKRDPSLAAEWLWKSVAKQNPQATLLLADLYLRGDGIQKNCDQARVLLGAAARKGQSGAGQRLRNMQAFGCQ